MSSPGTQGPKIFAQYYPVERDALSDNFQVPPEDVIGEVIGSDKQEILKTRKSRNVSKIH